MSETQQETVTLVVRHQVRPNHLPRYEAWLRRIITTASQCPGHLGVDVVRSRQPCVTLFTCVLRFASLQLRDAAASADAAKNLARLAGLPGEPT